MPERYSIAKIEAKRERMIFCRIGPSTGMLQLDVVEQRTRRVGLRVIASLSADQASDRQPSIRSTSIDEEVRDRHQDARLQRQLLPHVADERRSSAARDRSSGRRYTSTTTLHDRRVDQRASCVCAASSSCHLSVLGERVEHLGQLAGLLAGAHQADEHLVEDVRWNSAIASESFWPPSMSSSRPEITSRKRGFSTMSRRSVSASMIGTPAFSSCERWKQKLMRSVARDARAPPTRRLLRSVGAQVMRSSPRRVRRSSRSIALTASRLPGDALALGVDRAVGEERHRPHARSRSVRSTTREISSRLVVPAQHRADAVVGERAEALGRARRCGSRAPVARRAISSSMLGVDLEELHDRLRAPCSPCCRSCSQPTARRQGRRLVGGHARAGAAP